MWGLPSPSSPAATSYPGWLPRLLTHRIDGLDSWRAAFEHLGAPGAIKVYLEIAPLPS
jgi:hypothetical protein